MLFRLSFLSLAVMLVASVTSAAKAGDDDQEVLSLKMESLKGEEVDLSEYKGKVVMVVNVASRCGLTPQYEQLQTLHETYSENGLAVLGFPCNQFGKQEPGTATDISTFCTDNYGVTFDMFAKIEVNGDGACSLYKKLTSLDTQPEGSGPIKWNFEKFLLNREGEVVARFSPRTKPDAPEVIRAIEQALEEK